LLSAETENAIATGINASATEIRSRFIFHSPS
jgi:hypothetical protein